MLSEQIEDLLAAIESLGYPEVCDLLDERVQVIDKLKEALPFIHAYEFLAKHASFIKVEYSFGGNDKLYLDDVEFEDFHALVQDAMMTEFGDGEDEQEQEEEEVPRPYWVSWYHDLEAFGEFELHTPWWFSGGDLAGRDTVCAAVMAYDEVDAMERIYDCYDVRPSQIEFRFSEGRDESWSPFNSRFQKADWMKWQ
jgi:hypothetical protein